MAAHRAAPHRGFYPGLQSALGPLTKRVLSAEMAVTQEQFAPPRTGHRQALWLADKSHPKSHLKRTFTGSLKQRHSDGV